MRAPQLGILLLCIIVNTQEFLAKKLSLPILGLIDELALCTAYILVPLWLRRKEHYIFYAILLLPIFSILYSITANLLIWNESRVTPSIIQSIINCKLYILFALFFAIKEKYKISSSEFSKIFTICITISAIGFIANIVTPENFIFSEEVWHIERNRIVGFQYKPNDLGLALALFFFLLLFSGQRKASNFILIGIVAVACYLTGSRTSLAVMAIAIACYISIKSKHKPIIIATLVLAIPFIVSNEAFLNSFLVKETLSNTKEIQNINQSQYIRAIVIFYGIQLSLAYFPLGVGAGNYGGVASEGSPAYDSLGLSNSQFFSELSGVYDSNLASILGEYGIIGVLITILITYKILTKTLENKRLATGLLFTTLFISISQPMFSYHVNSINLILLSFSIPSQNQKKSANQS
ncbi:MAG: hypothetical protein CMK74_05705 [Pseudomonadales bacterium]|nr:hypothetical protein [Pseudomonadales bacterium]